MWNARTFVILLLFCPGAEGLSAEMQEIYEIQSRPLSTKMEWEPQFWEKECIPLGSEMHQCYLPHYLLASSTFLPLLI